MEEEGASTVFQIPISQLPILHFLEIEPVMVELKEWEAKAVVQERMEI